MPTKRAADLTQRDFRYTERVRAIVNLAREEAVRLHCDCVETEHLLLAIIREGEGIGATVLTNLGFDFGQMGREIEDRSTHSDSDAPSVDTIRFSPQARRVLVDLADDEAQALGHSYVGTEHVLLALMLDAECTAAQVLSSLGLTLPRARQEVKKLLGAGPGGGLDIGSL